MATLTSALVLLGQEETFVDKDLLYVCGGLLVLLALVLSFAGMRIKDFPSRRVLPVILGITAAIVVLTGFAAYKSATFEQAKRRAQNEQAGVKAEGQNVANQQSENNAATGQAGDTTSGTGATPGSSDPGLAVFANNGCGSCHTFKAAGATGTSGPNLDEFLAPDDDKAGIKEMIVDPNAEIAKGYSANVMPQDLGTTLSPTEINQLVAFLYKNSPAGSQGGAPAESKGAAKQPKVDVADGKKMFASNGCSSCHTLAAANASGTIGPNLDDVIPDLSASDIKTSIVDPNATITPGFPAGTMPQSFGDTMSDQQVNDLVAYLQSVAGKG